MSQGGGKSFFRKHLMRKCSSVLCSFLEAAFKRRSTATEPEIKQLMSAQLKTHLAVHGGGRTMIEKWLIGKRMFNSKFTVMPDLQWITFLGFKIFKVMQYMCSYNSCKIIFFISLTKYKSYYGCYFQHQFHLWVAFDRIFQVHWLHHSRRVSHV